MKIESLNSDKMGIISSLLCLLHCALTPLLFISQPTILNSYKDFPEIWWRLASLLIIPVSLYAVYRSNKNTTNKSLGVAMWLCCFILLSTIINEAFEIFSLKEYFSYGASITLGFLHVYNLKYCTCEDDDCCTHK